MYTQLYCFIIFVLGNSIGSQYSGWRDCKVLRKFYEKNVLWAHVEYKQLSGETRPLRPPKIRYTLLRLKTTQLPDGQWVPCLNRTRARSCLLRCARIKLRSGYNEYMHIRGNTFAFFYLFILHHTVSFIG